jgi:hypothetical protein
MANVYGIQLYKEELVWVVKMLRLLNQCQATDRNCFEGELEFYFADLLQGRFVRYGDEWTFEPVLKVGAEKVEPSVSDD